MAARSEKEIKVYKMVFELAMDIFKITNRFPREERYSSTDQIRRSSRSVCICLLEVYGKKRFAYCQLLIACCLLPIAYCIFALSLHIFK
ncbi:MAG TPA: four helix bundle protein [Chitinophagaceae bacterium]|nr:four helix bundle protein [Chitinophagaceae bacterium]